VKIAVFVPRIVGRVAETAVVMMARAAVPIIMKIAPLVGKIAAGAHG